MQIAEIKSYLRINHDLDDMLLLELIDEAKMYVKGVCGVEYSSEDLQYRQLIRFIVQQRYDNREAISDRPKSECDYTITNLLQHIAMRGAIDVKV